MQQALYIIEKWCQENMLSVNPSKTGAILFTRQRDNTIGNPPKIYNVPLTFVEEVKYLGVTLDRKLLFNKHLENKLEKATKAFWQCRRALGKTWGLTPKVMHWIYTAMIRPSLTFACIVWWPRTRLKTVQDKLQRLQRLACLSITSSSRTSPTSALETFLNLPPLSLYIEGEALISAHRLNDVNEWKIGGFQAGHSVIFEKSLLSGPDWTMRSDRIKPNYSFNAPFHINIPTREKWNTDPPSIIAEKGINIYTDGSKMSENSGAGIFSNNLSITVPLGKYATVFQAEVLAISIAAHEALKLTNREPIRIM